MRGFQAIDIDVPLPLRHISSEGPAVCVSPHNNSHINFLFPTRLLITIRVFSHVLNKRYY
jgi:hypothetical protein